MLIAIVVLTFLIISVGNNGWYTSVFCMCLLVDTNVIPMMFLSTYEVLRSNSADWVAGWVNINTFL